MTAISITCPFCDSKMNAPAKAAGRQVKCPRCEMDFKVQGHGESTAPQDQPPLPQRTPYTESKHTESTLLTAGRNGGIPIPSEGFYFTDRAALLAQVLSVISGFSFSALAVQAVMNAAILVAIQFFVGAFSCAWFFAMAGAVRAVVHIARRA